MQTLPRQTSANPWLIRFFTLLLAALVTASAAYWVLKWPTPSSAARSVEPMPPPPPIDSSKVAQLLGASPAGEALTPTTAPANYKLLGVIAQGGPSNTNPRGSALIAVDNSPAKPYRVGDQVTDTLVLQSVKARSVTLGPQGQAAGTVMLELPPVPGMPTTP